MKNNELGVYNFSFDNSLSNTNSVDNSELHTDSSNFCSNDSPATDDSLDNPKFRIDDKNRVQVVQQLRRSNRIANKSKLNYIHIDRSSICGGCGK